MGSSKKHKERDREKEHKRKRKHRSKSRSRSKSPDRVRSDRKHRRRDEDRSRRKDEYYREEGPPSKEARVKEDIAQGETVRAKKDENAAGDNRWIYATDYMHQLSLGNLGH